GARHRGAGDAARPRRRGDRMNRRGFITLLGGAAAWPLAAHAQQQGERVRRIGVLMGYAGSNVEGQVFVAAFREELLKLGWTEHRNLRSDYRWAPPGAGSGGQLGPSSISAFCVMRRAAGRPACLASGRPARDACRPSSALVPAPRPTFLRPARSAIGIRACPSSAPKTIDTQARSVPPAAE